MKVSANVPKVYAFSFFWMFLVLMPVLIPYFLQLGLSMEQIFQLQAVFGVSIVILELPSGYFCDLIGRKLSLALGALVAACAFTWLCFIEDFKELIVYEFVIGIALSLVSGADISLLYDSLGEEEEGRPKKVKAMANMQLSAVTAESIGAILGGLLVKISYSAVLITHAAFSWLPFFIALTLKEPERKRLDHSDHIANFKKIFSHIFRSDRLLRLIVFNLVVWGLATFVAVWMFQKYWQENNIPLHYFGFLWAGYNLTVGIVGKQVDPLEHKWGPIPLLCALSLLPIVGHLGMGFLTGWWGVIAGLCFQMSRGICNVLLKDALNSRTPGEFRATVNSLVGLFFRLGFCLLGPAVGYAIDKWGLAFSFRSLALLFSVFFFVAMRPLIGELRRRNFPIT